MKNLKIVYLFYCINVLLFYEIWKIFLKLFDTLAFHVLLIVQQVYL